MQLMVSVRYVHGSQRAARTAVPVLYSVFEYFTVKNDHVLWVASPLYTSRSGTRLYGSIYHIHLYGKRYIRIFFTIEYEGVIIISIGTHTARCRFALLNIYLFNRGSNSPLC